MREKARLFLEHLEATPADAATRLVFADWLEDELGLGTVAAFQRWLARNPGVMRHPDPDPESPWGIVVDVDLDSLPGGLVHHLPLSLSEVPVLASGHIEWKSGLITTDGLWVCRADAERGLLAAWLAREAEVPPLFGGIQ